MRNQLPFTSESVYNYLCDVYVCLACYCSGEVLEKESAASNLGVSTIIQYQIISIVQFFP